MNWPSSSQKNGSVRNGRCTAKSGRASSTKQRRRGKARRSARATKPAERCARVGGCLTCIYAYCTILLQHVRQRLCLRRAEEDALKVLNRHRVGSGLLNRAKQQKEVPQTDAHLHAVRIILPIIGRRCQLNFWLWLSCCHVFSITERSGAVELGRGPVLIGISMKLQSYTITQGKDRAPARSYLKSIGYTDEDLKKPIIGIANTWIGTMPCNFLLRDFAVDVAKGIREAGGTPMEFNTIAISDGITMGTEGMKTSLVSREVIADSIELVARGHMFDGLVALVACDKTIPGAAMALLRLNVPAVILYGGTILPGKYRGRDITIQDVFEAVGAN